MDKDIIQRVTQSVVDKTLELLSDKVIRIVLYGSYARGDYTPESDVDVMILLNCSADEIPAYRRMVCRLASSLSLESGKEISLMLQDKETYDKWIDTLVFYQNVEKEGVILYGDR